MNAAQRWIRVRARLRTPLAPRPPKLIPRYTVSGPVASSQLPGKTLRNLSKRIRHAVKQIGFAED